MMKMLKIRKSQTVVVYDTSASWLYSARAAFMLKTYGHPEVYILDGGYNKWLADGGKVEVSDYATSFDEDFDYTLDADRIFSYE